VPQTRRLRRTALNLAALTVAALVALAACGSDDVDQARPVTGTPVAHAADTTTSTTAPPVETATSVPAEPPAVILAGDSIIYDVSPAIVEALDPATARVVPMVAPSLSAESSQAALIEAVRTEQPDVVVVMVGVWERVYRSPDGRSLGEPGWAEAYAAAALDPVVAEVTANGGRLVILGPPHIRVADDDAEIAQLEQVWSDYADAHPAVTFVDADGWLIDSDVFVELDTAGPAPVRIRRIDGIHLCEEGARRIATGVLAQLAPELEGVATPPRPGWETGAWTERFPADECPPTSA
jgi:hypothetical protein